MAVEALATGRTVRLPCTLIHICRGKMAASVSRVSPPPHTLTVPTLSGDTLATHPHTQCHWPTGSLGDRGTDRSQVCSCTRLPGSCSGGLHTHPHLQGHTGEGGD